MSPKVSICVPNLNTRPFLPERFETIFNQSLQDWELLIYDSHSEDGAWEYICEVAQRDSRIRAWQGPRAGTPGSWTPCIREARGEYVYVATSDDTMARDCLQKMVEALDVRPDCGLAHCWLRTIDENGRDCRDWWSQQSTFARSSGELMRKPHVRLAPFDGLLHLLGKSVYISITQLLIRRSLFDRVGYFESRWGPVGDFNWSMRAGLVTNTVHVPDTWGGWRLHSSQATAAARLDSPEHAGRIEEMIEDALQTCEKHLTPAVRGPLRAQWCGQARDLRLFLRDLNGCQGLWRRRAFIAGRLFSGSRAARRYLASRLAGQHSFPRSAPGMIQSWLEDAGAGSVLVPINADDRHEQSATPEIEGQRAGKPHRL